MQAAYTLIDDETLDRLLELDGDSLIAALEELETGAAPTAYIDKLWDGLHFLLTGFPTSEPIEGDPLSEAVVGVHVIDEDDYVACTEADELASVIAALAAVDLDRISSSVDFTSFAAAGVTPNIWSDSPAALRSELSDALALLLDIHRRADAAGQHLLVSII